ncbi:hypothetical protein [Anabaena subtropica]|uniref:Uncharacterized protein n=1 Tax=Anabaena subtropica FACHB-260 TaxID=2692884 RepID=A0ABR8CN23_9NOST|nr:hypothetical protein [Anabaena subtropica]MBD2344186.1 hypothetical protein [Anabaena subtropica FACHB-260]
MTETEIFNNIPQPDPSWDYYEVWQALHLAQSKIKSGVKVILGQEQANHDTDQKLKEILEAVVEELEQVIDHNLSAYADEEIY